MAAQKKLTNTFISTVAIQLGSRGIAVLIGIIVARALGPEDYGRYSFILSTIAIATLPCIAGLPILLIREISRYRVQNTPTFLSGILIWSRTHILLISLISTVVYFTLSLLGIKDESTVSIMIFCTALIPFKGLIIRYECILNGLQHPILALLPMAILAPLFVLIVLLGDTYLHFQHLSPKFLIALQFFVHIFALVFSYYLVKRVIPDTLDEAKAQLHNTQWRRALFPLAMLAIVGTMTGELTIIILGLLGDEKSVGYFKVAVQGVSLLALSLDSLNKITGPKIAGLYSKGHYEEIQRLLTHSVRISVFTSLPFALLLVLFGDSFIIILFGEAYLPAQDLLIILCLGQIANICMGSAGLVMNMTGHEKSTLKIDLLLLALTLMSLVLFIPFWGAIGAAITATIGMILWNVIMAINVYRKTGLKTWFRFTYEA